MPRLYPSLMVLALFLAAGMAVDAAWSPRWIAGEPPAVALPAPLALGVRASRGCPNCAWIESKREIVPAVADAGALRVFEYTLRMANGSSSVFLETLPASWRLRERLIVIDGAEGRHPASFSLPAP